MMFLISSINFFPILQENQTKKFNQTKKNTILQNN